MHLLVIPSLFRDAAADLLLYRQGNRLADRVTPRRPAFAVSGWQQVAEHVSCCYGNPVMSVLSTVSKFGD